MSRTEIYASLQFRLFDRAIEVAEICETLKIAPERVWNIGESRMTPRGTLLSGIYDYSYCSFALIPKDDEDLDEFLERTCISVQPHRDFFKKIRTLNGVIDLYITWVVISNIGIVFDHKLLLKLGELGIDLGFEILTEPEQA
jgi:Domain of unknown function (DUF4279)